MGSLHYLHKALSSKTNQPLGSASRQFPPASGLEAHPGTQSSSHAAVVPVQCVSHRLKGLRFEDQREQRKKKEGKTSGPSLNVFCRLSKGSTAMPRSAARLLHSQGRSAVGAEGRRQKDAGGAGKRGRHPPVTDV